MSIVHRGRGVMNYARTCDDILNIMCRYEIIQC